VARAFDGTNDEIRVAIGNCNITGAITMAAIFRRGATGAYHGIVALHQSGGTAEYSLEISDSTNQVDFTGITSWPDAGGGLGLTAVGWYCVTVTKAAGTSTPRGTVYAYSTNTQARSNGNTTLADQTSVSGGTVRFGEWQDVDDFEGDLLVAGIWNRQLSDAEVDLLPFALNAWVSAAPSGLWLFEQSAVSQNVVDLTGGGANQSGTGGAITQTTISSIGQPVFNYGAGPAWYVIRPQDGGGTTQFITPDGTITSAGNLIKEPRTRYTGTLTSAGALVKQAITRYTGAITSAGNLLKSVTQALAGTVTSSGALTALKVAVLSAAGTITPSGNLIRQPILALAATISSSGTLIKSVALQLAGTLTSSSTLANLQVRILNVSGTLTSVGNLIKQPLTVYAGSIAPAAGALVLSVSKLLAGTISSSSTLLKSAARTFAGTLTSSSTLANLQVRTIDLAGSIASAGIFVGKPLLAFAGSFTPAGALSKSIATRFLATITSSGLATVFRVTTRTFTGTLTSTGSLRNLPQLALSGTISLASTIRWAISHAFAGNLTPTSVLANIKATSLLLSGTLTLAGSNVNVLSQNLRNFVYVIRSAAAQRWTVAASRNWRVLGRKD
jgi:hypothetical protein